MDQIIISKVLISEIKDLKKISRQTFIETFSADNTIDNMDKYLKGNLSTEKLLEECRNKNTEFYFAKLDGDIIGYLKLNFAESQTELQEEHGLEIERIYVAKKFHGKNVGQLLYQKAIEIAKRKRIDYIWLGVWEQNSRAINFYKKNGFVEFDKHIFKLGNDKQTDIMMKQKLNKED